MACHPGALGVDSVSVLAQTCTAGEARQRQRRTPTLYVGLALEDASEGKHCLSDKFDNCALAVSPKELAKENEALERVSWNEKTPRWR